MLADILGTKKAYLKAKIEELGYNSKLKNIRDLYRGISDFKKGYRPRKRRMVFWLQNPAEFWLSGGTIFHSY
jgi:hypothetical protein